MPNLCGVNQKLIVEALTTLKKGKFVDTFHKFEKLFTAFT